MCYLVLAIYIIWRSASNWYSIQSNYSCHTSLTSDHKLQIFKLTLKARVSAWKAPFNFSKNRKRQWAFSSRNPKVLKTSLINKFYQGNHTKLLFKFLVLGAKFINIVSNIETWLVALPIKASLKWYERNEVCTVYFVSVFDNVIRELFQFDFSIDEHLKLLYLVCKTDK